MVVLVFQLIVYEMNIVTIIKMLKRLLKCNIAYGEKLATTFFRIVELTEDYLVNLYEYTKYLFICSLINLYLKIMRLSMVY